MEEKKQMLDVRITTLEKQENKIKEKAETIQKEIMKDLESKNDDHKTN